MVEIEFNICFLADPLSVSIKEHLMFVAGLAMILTVTSITERKMNGRVLGHLHVGVNFQ